MDRPFTRLVAVLTPKRRWAQFSLFTMLVVVTALSICLAVAANRSARRRTAITEINRLGGWVRYEFDDEHDWGTLATLRLPGRIDALFCRVVEVEMWPSRESFMRGGGLLMGLMPFAAEPIDNDGLRFVAELSELESLSLGYSDIDDEGLVYLRGLTKLKNLMLRETFVTDAGVADLKKALPNCQIVR